MLMKIKAKGKGTTFDQSPIYLKHLKCTTQRCPRTSNYEHSVESVATPLWAKCEDEIHTPKSGNLESSGSPATSRLDSRGKKTSP